MAQEQREGSNRLRSRATLAASIPALPVRIRSLDVVPRSTERRALWSHRGVTRKTPACPVTGRDSPLHDALTGAALPSGEAATCVESSCHLRLACQHGTSFALCSTFFTGDSEPRNQAPPPAAGRHAAFCQVISNRPHPCLVVHGLVFAVPNSFAVFLATRPARSLVTPCVAREQPSPSL